MTGYLWDIWACRFFWLTLVKTDLRTRYRGSIFGLGWSLLQPIAMTIILCTVFHTLFHSEIKTYAPYLLSGLTFWSFITTVIPQGCQSFFAGEAYIRQFPAPLAIYPLRVTLGAAFHYLLALVVVIALTWKFMGLSHPWALLGLVPAVLLLVMMGWALAVLAGFAHLYFQDTQHLTEIGLQILFYLTPIMFPASMLKDNHLGWVVDYNPLMLFLRLLREPILEGRIPSVVTYGQAGLTVLVFGGAASFCLARFGRRVIFLL